MIRIAATGDLHFGRNSGGKLRNHLDKIRELADFLLLAGDLTQVGHIEEAKVLAEDLSYCQVPVIAVLGNHDYHLDHNLQIKEILCEAGVAVLDRNIFCLDLGHTTVGIVGMKGFGGGFIGACASDFGEPEMKSFIRSTKMDANYLKSSLLSLNTDYKIALLHYSPVADTLFGERREIYPFLGSYLLGEAADQGRADIIIHGHAHAGVEKGFTPGGIPVRNVAQHVIRHAFHIYSLKKEEHQSVSVLTDFSASF